MGEGQLEIWKPVVGYEGIFSVSNLGRIRNENKKFGNQYFGKTRIGKKDPITGYYSIRLCKDYEVRIHSVHGIVARSFLGERPHGTVINHKDGNKLNNALSNLEYVTRSENCRHAVRLGLCDLAKQFGVKQPTISEIVNRKAWTHV